MFSTTMSKSSGSAHKRLGDDIGVPYVAAVSEAIENVSRGAQGEREKAPASERFAMADGHAKVRESTIPPEIDGSFVIVSEIPTAVVERETSLPAAQSHAREVLTAESREPADNPPAVKEPLDTQEDLIEDSAEPILSRKENAPMDDDTKKQKHDVLEETKGSPEKISINFPDVAVAVEEDDSAPVEASKSSTIVSVAEEKHGDGKVGSLSVEGSSIAVFVSEIPVKADDSAGLAEVTAGVEESSDDAIKDAGVFTEATQGVAKGRMATDDRVVNGEKTDMLYSGESKLCRMCLQKIAPTIVLPITWL